MSGEQSRQLHPTTPPGRRAGRRLAVAGPHPPGHGPGAPPGTAPDQVREIVRAALAEDRDRIARDLHDHVIQRVFAASLALHCVAARLPDDETRGRVSAVLDQLDDAVHDIRSAIFELRPSGSGQVRRRLHDLATVTAAGVLQPIVLISGPVDRLCDGVAADVQAVVQEAVSNAARHSGGGRVSVTVAVADEVVVEVVDDGRGIEDAVVRSGLANLEERARRRGGTFAVTTLPAGGTRLLWRIPRG